MPMQLMWYRYIASLYVINISKYYLPMFLKHSFEIKYLWRKYFSRKVRKRILKHVRPAKSLISLRIRADWSESSLDAFWTTKDATFLHTYNEDSEQVAQIRRLIWVFVGRTCQKVRFFTLWCIYWVVENERNNTNMIPFNFVWYLSFSLFKLSSFVKTERNGKISMELPSLQSRVS